MLRGLFILPQSEYGPLAVALLNYWRKSYHSGIFFVFIFLLHSYAAISNIPFQILFIVFHLSDRDVFCY